MSLLGSLFGSTVKQTSTGTSKVNKTSQRTNPAFIEDLAKGFAGEIGDLSKMDPNTFVPGATGLQTKAFDATAGAIPLDDAFRGGLDMTAAVGNGAAPRTRFVDSTSKIASFQNPFDDEVLARSLGDFDVDAGRTRAQQALDLAGAGAFGGSGAALTQSMTEGELARARGGLSAGLRSEGWRQALAAAQNEAAREQGVKDMNAQLEAQQRDRTLSAGRSLADIASAYGGERRSDAASAAGLGTLQRDIQTEQARAPIDFLRDRQDLFAGLLPELFGGETTNIDSTETSTTKKKGTPSAMEGIGQALQIAALFASDRRLKEGCVHLYDRPDGIGVWLFRYLGKAQRYIGVMAQEVLKVKPEAVVTMPSGLYAVDYSKL